MVEIELIALVYNLSKRTKNKAKSTSKNSFPLKQKIKQPRAKICFKCAES
ncbi:hypothetical protein HMPREF9715_02321 [Myroides odoratimimus CIP 101113]|uniref:50S ribosomal protein L33 n=1 Tax=Myroides odoratimimus CIP 101113 TaxID=883154 RepID=A0AAV3F1I7_9FLAO|nr:hypothetical protein HMPREF9715_02321 [Myroides odoratimimus CIP 101113]